MGNVVNISQGKALVAVKKPYLFAVYRLVEAWLSGLPRITHTAAPVRAKSGIVAAFVLLCMAGRDKMACHACRAGCGYG